MEGEERGSVGLSKMVMQGEEKMEGKNKRDRYTLKSTVYASHIRQTVFEYKQTCLYTCT